MPFFPLAVGFLGGLEVLTRPAERLDVSTSAVALAWLLRRSPVMIPIPGTKSLEHLGDNIRATEVATQLTDEEVRALAEVEDEESATLSMMSTQMADASAPQVSATHCDITHTDCRAPRDPDRSRRGAG